MTRGLAMTVERQQQSVKEITGKPDRPKIRNVSSVKDTFKRRRREATGYKKYLRKAYLIKNFYPPWLM